MKTRKQKQEKNFYVHWATLQVLSYTLDINNRQCYEVGAKFVNVCMAHYVPRTLKMSIFLFVCYLVHLFQVIQHLQLSTKHERGDQTVFTSQM